MILNTPLDELSSSKRKQRTLKSSASISGIGLFTGVKATMKFIPAPENTGIVFKRVDRLHAPALPANVDYVRGTNRCTILGDEDLSVHTVEHVLSALKAFEIDNLIIEINGPEVPSCDGSALPFVNMIEHAGIAYQQFTKTVFHLQHPLFWSKGDVHLVALPAEEFRITYTLNYPHCDLLKSQFYTFHMNEEGYKSEIAPARTFSLYEEIVPLIEKGMIKGGTLDNAVIIKGGSILNPEGARFADEMVRHKILDLIGDLSLVGCCFLAHVIAIRSGHFSNTSFANELVNYFKVGCR